MRGNAMISGRSEFGLPVNMWLSRRDAVVGLLLSSLFINTLGLVFPICVLQFYDRVIPNRSFNTLMAMITIVLAALVLELALKLLRAYVSAWSSARFTYNMGRELFHHLAYCDITQFRQHTAGEYLDKFNLAESIREYYCGQNLTLLVDIPFIAIYLILMFIISPIVAIVPCLVVMYMVASGAIVSERVKKKVEGKTSMSDVKSKFLVEMLSGIHTIKALGMEEQFLRRYERLHQREIESNFELIQNTSESSRNASMYSQLAIILTGCVGGILVIYHMLTVGGLAAEILIVGRLMLPITKLITYFEKKKELYVAMQALHFINKFTDEYSSNLQKLDNFKGDISLQNVSFKYPDNEKFIIEDINLSISSNETVILHGGLGSGKSTLLLIMSSLYKPTEGRIAIDGIDVKQIDLDNYRNQIAYMSGNGELFDATILENLTFFEPEKYGQEAKELAEQLGLHDVIEAMPQAYDTRVGSGTVDLLSKGHKHLVLIIRSLINEPKLILFDEANLALDVDSDVRLRKYLHSKKGQCTMVLATHRPSIIAMGDRHIRLTDGKMTEFKWE